MKIDKPKLTDLKEIKKILTQWTEKEEVIKYLQRIKNEIEGTTEFNMHFWVARGTSPPATTEKHSTRAPR